MSSPNYFMEIGQDFLRVLAKNNGLELPLERRPDGRLTDACRERTTARLSEFLRRKPWQPRARVCCAVGARGVSVRRLTLPRAGREETRRLLLLQIEGEFPLAPDELAWGSLKLGDNHSKQEMLVVALKKELLEEYLELLTACGAAPVFTLAALGRNYLCSRPPAAYAVLELGRTCSELAVFEQGVLASVRTIPWAGRVPVDGDGDEAPGGEAATTADGLEALTASLNGLLAGRKVYLSGPAAAEPDLAARLARRLGGGIECEPLKLAPGEGRSAALLGLRQAAERDQSWPPLVLEVRPAAAVASRRLARPAPLKWAALALLLVLAWLALPYAEAMVFKGRLARRLASIKSERARLATIDSELDFLRFLKENQPPYLDALYVLARSAPPGAHFDTIALNRKGELSLRGYMQGSPAVAEFRSKLIHSGLFSNIAVEEQTPTPDRQRVNLRISALWKGTAVPDSVVTNAAAADAAKARDGGSGVPMGTAVGMPMGMPMAMPVPVGAEGGPPGMITVPGGAAVMPGPAQGGVVLPAGIPPGALPPGAMPEGVKVIRLRSTGQTPAPGDAPQP